MSWIKRIYKFPEHECRFPELPNIGTTQNLATGSEWQCDVCFRRYFLTRICEKHHCFDCWHQLPPK